MRSYYFFIIEIVVESANLIQMSKIENYDQHDGEQLLFSKKVYIYIYIYIKTQSKKKAVLVIFILL